MTDHCVLIEEARANLLHPGALDGLLQDEVQGRLLRLADALAEALEAVAAEAALHDLTRGERDAAERRAAESEAERGQLRAAIDAAWATTQATLQGGSE